MHYLEHLINEGIKIDATFKLLLLKDCWSVVNLNIFSLQSCDWLLTDSAECSDRLEALKISPPESGAAWTQFWFETTACTFSVQIRVRGIWSLFSVCQHWVKFYPRDALCQSSIGSSSASYWVKSLQGCDVSKSDHCQLVQDKKWQCNYSTYQPGPSLQ